MGGGEGGGEEVKLSDLIKQLQELQAKYGDLPVYGVYDGYSEPGVEVKHEEACDTGSYRQPECIEITSG